MTTSKIQITEGSGKNIATHSVSEDAVTKEIQRVVINDNAGADVSIATQTTLAALLAKFASGTVIGDVNLGATDNAVLDTIDAVLDTIKTDTEAIKTSVQLIDNIVGSINGAGAPVIDSYTHLAINLAAGANQSLVAAPGASKQIWVYGVNFTTNVAGTVSFQDEDDTAITGIMQIGITGGLVSSPSGNFAMPIWKVATNKALEVDVVTAELDGWLDYAIVSI